MGKNKRTTLSVTPGTIELPVEMSVPDDASRLVIFSHAWGTALDSDTNQYMAERLRERGFATIRPALLTGAEQDVHENELDWQLQASRLLDLTAWARKQESTQGLDVSYFGTSTGAVPALRAATRTDVIDSVVTRGGRLDLAPRAMESLDAPILMIVGTEDEPVLSINQSWARRLEDQVDLSLIDGAGHTNLPEEHVEAMSERAAEWLSNGPSNGK